MKVIRVCSALCVSLVFCALYAQEWERFEQKLTGSTISFNNKHGHSWADVDGDGDFDLFTNGSRRLWLNKIHEGEGFVRADELIPSLSGSGWAACFADFDNDGDLDIFCGNTGEDFLLENRLPEPFVNVGPDYQLTDPRWCQSVNWADYNADGRLDIYITHETPDGDGPHRFYESDYPNPFIKRFPTTINAPDDFGLADKNSHAYGLAWADIDIDGDLDVVTSACGFSNTIPGQNPHNKVYRNKAPEIGFEDVSLSAGLVDESEMSNGSDAYWAILFDNNGDALPDLFIGDNNTNHRMWNNVSGPNDIRLDQVDALGSISTTGAFIKGAAAGDFDNDGDLDLYTATEGLLVNDGTGNYHLQSGALPRGSGDASWVDFDMDGQLDLFNFDDLFRNPGNPNNHWIAIELEGDPKKGTTRDAFHVKIQLTANGIVQHREHRFMVGTYSQHVLPTHFGLGDAEIVDEIRIIWHNGEPPTVLTDIPVDRYIRIRQDADCSDTVTRTAAETHYVCQGDVLTLSAETESEEPLQWQVISGPDMSLHQFDTTTGTSVQFTAARAGAYTLGVSLAGCPQTTRTFVTLDSDFDENGLYGAGDLFVAVSGWGTDERENYERNGDGNHDILDLMSLCESAESADAPTLARLRP
ncbi:CRTAC1 family protein [Sulfidibacter corallicola]|uniref:CRTAC1 family protein n=1 Tax=Sulfidibacter corallicola TaxID=2818388 RepID=A0A8A4THQ5_SULCO|nr:CRTAC1 family protein [Sulfidibacter corallicola]QTD49163.1 CRTAC1 family protein [Sulfidibacter corallicola]